VAGLVVGVVALVSSFALLASSCSSPATAPVPRVVGHTLVDGTTGHSLRLLGFDVTGTEDACVLDMGFGWAPMTASEAGDIAAWHANAVRVPLNEDCWLGINGVPAKYSGAAYQAAVEAWVADLNAAGLVVILDLQWSAPGSHEATQQWPAADADHSITFWTKVATTFKSDPSLVFDLFNEAFIGGRSPSVADWQCWLDGCTTSFTCSSCSAPVTYHIAGMQSLVTAVRRTGARQPVVVGGLNFASDPCGVDNGGGGNGGNCMWLQYEPHDPDHQVIADFHSYNTDHCNTVDCWDASVLPVAARVPVVTDELGESDCSASYIDEFMNWADQRRISYLAWAWEVPNATSTTCSSANLYLLSNWDGHASTLGIAGSAFHVHLAALAGK
jgi:endoglucanase